MSDGLRIGHSSIGLGNPCFIIAEAGVNHNGSLALARQLVDAAADAGADAVKFQSFKADLIVTAHACRAAYQVENTGEDGSQLAMLKRLELSAADETELKKHCDARGILFLSTPFDEISADRLDELGVVAFKISSGDVTNLPMLRHIAKKRKPVILSTGMSDLDEVRRAVQALLQAGNDQLILLHCVSCYPADPADVNLRAMHALREAFGCPVGFSDHTMGTEVAFAAVALGAQVVEKHFTLDRSQPGPDHKASLEPDELRALVEGIRKVESALGSGKKTPAEAEADTAAAARRSLVAACDLEAGTVLAPEHVAVKRPGLGLSPSMLDQIVGRKLTVAVQEDEPFSLGMFE